MTDQPVRRCQVRNCGYMVAPPHTYCERHRYRERKKTLPGKTELTDDDWEAYVRHRLHNSGATLTVYDDVKPTETPDGAPIGVDGTPRTWTHGWQEEP
mgnify:CR=1 FL=1